MNVEEAVQLCLGTLMKCLRYICIDYKRNGRLMRTVTVNCDSVEQLLTELRKEAKITSVKIITDYEMSEEDSKRYS